MTTAGSLPCSPHTTLNSIPSYREKSGLPFYDVLLLDDLPKPASLPVATSLAVKSRILNGSYDFDYFYFTESDQVAFLCPSHPIPLVIDFCNLHPLDLDASQS
jgi:hypothetical protein